MAKAGMRYQRTKNLIKQVEEKQKRMNEILKRLEEERVSEVGAVYGGEAADNFKGNVKTIADDLNTKITKIIQDLNVEADTQYDNYKKQEAALKSNIPTGGN